MNKYKLIMLAIGISLLSGCASIVNGTNQTVSVTTPPVKNAQCKLKNKKGTWYVNKTPGSVVIHRAYGPLEIECNKSGFAQVKKTVKSHTKGMAFGNVVLGGVIGAGVDMADGSAYDYPQHIIIPMEQLHKKKAMS